ncbi:MAG: LOG family protein [Ignavibacteria bacterium]|nr:LOG family protein [Ignavibacteria bacterium]
MAPTKFTTKAYKNLDFLNSSDARPLRLLAEYFEPQQRIRKNQIQDTIVFFGSARLMSREAAEQRKQEVLASINSGGARGASKKLVADLQDAERHVTSSEYYEDAVELAKLLSKWSLGLSKKNRFVICSGGGPGIMEAANKGAQLAGAKSIGLNISLPFEQEPNPYIPPELNMEFHYFFMRKFWFVYPAKALVVFPGGFGTMDELFEVLTLVQTDKLRKEVFIVLYGSDFWKKVINFDALMETRLISREDMNLFTFANTPKEAFTHLRKKLTERYL